MPNFISTGELDSAFVKWRSAARYAGSRLTHLRFADASHDQTILFFLLHEQPESVRRRTLSEAVRVTRPGGRIVIVDYHLPQRFHPLRYLFQPILRWLEPFALDLWNHSLDKWLPKTIRAEQIRKETSFGGLYQKVVITV